MKKGSCLPNIFSQVIYSGGYSDGEPPLPIPNREAKPVIADGTARPGGRVGSRRAWKESSDEKSSGDSFSCLQVSCENIRCTRHMAMRVSLWTVLMTEPCLSVSLFCRCPIYMSMRVSLWAVPVVDVCLRVSLLCGCPRHLSTQVSLRPVPMAGLCGPGVTRFPVGLPSGPVDRCICHGCPRPMSTCVMAVSVSPLLTGKCIRNCLYLN